MCLPAAWRRCVYSVALSTVGWPLLARVVGRHRSAFMMRCAGSSGVHVPCGHCPVVVWVCVHPGGMHRRGWCHCLGHAGASSGPGGGRIVRCCGSRTHMGVARRPMPQAAPQVVLGKVVHQHGTCMRLSIAPTPLPAWQHVEPVHPPPRPATAACACMSDAGAAARSAVAAGARVSVSLDALVTLAQMCVGAVGLVRGRAPAQEWRGCRAPSVLAAVSPR